MFIVCLCTCTKHIADAPVIWIQPVHMKFVPHNCMPSTQCTYTLPCRHILYNINDITVWLVSNALSCSYIQFMGCIYLLTSYSTLNVTLMHIFTLSDVYRITGILRKYVYIELGITKHGCASFVTAAAYHIYAAERPTCIERWSGGTGVKQGYHIIQQNIYQDRRDYNVCSADV